MRSATLLLITAAQALTPLSTHQRAAEHAKNVQRHETDLADSATRWGAPITVPGDGDASWRAVAAPRTVLAAPSVMPRAVARRIKREADALFSRQTSMSRFSMTEDLRDCHADELPRTKLWLRAFVASKRFTGALRVPEALNATSLAIYDALIVKYAPDLARDRAASGQPVHRDFSTLTLNIALSDARDFIGGGTRFEGPGDVTLTPVRAGDAVAHAGRTRHAGAATTEGERYVLVCFLASVKPDHARLALARAMDLRRAGKYARAVRAARSRLRDEGHGWPRRWPTPRRRTSRKRQAWRPTTSPRCTASRRWRSRALRREKTSGPPRSCAARRCVRRGRTWRGRTRRTTSPSRTRRPSGCPWRWRDDTSGGD
jgi:predicted 2-oxoglutarate/Fe(II)-dependent dioxygenase YbiX